MRTKKFNDYTIKEDHAVIHIKDRECLVDLDDLKRLIEFGYKWGLNTHGYAMCMVRDGKKHKTVQMHRFIHNPSPEMVVDHIFHNKLDNRKSKTRVVSRSFNSLNRKATCGVCYDKHDKRKKRWRSYINIDGKRKYIGRYETEEQAREIAKAERIKVMGE